MNGWCLPGKHVFVVLLPALCNWDDAPSLIESCSNIPFIPLGVNGKGVSQNRGRDRTTMVVRTTANCFNCKWFCDWNSSITYLNP